eukprot:SAG11_NODE_26208_length_348_cov_1.028112_1_plen_30_part_10
MERHSYDAADRLRRCVADRVADLRNWCAPP